MRAAIYTRISRDTEGRSLGVRRQEEDCRALAKQRKWKVVEVFSDNDVSAGGQKKRPGWEALLDALEKHEIDAVVAYSSSRMYRRPADLQRLIDLAKANGGVEIATCVSGQIDLSTADGRMVAGLLAQIDQGELERVSERQRRQIKSKKKAGEWTGGRLPFGYRPEDGKLVVYEPEAKLIREGAIAVLNGQSVRSVARAWNKTSTTTGGGVWRPGHVRMVLSRNLPGIITTTDSKRLQKLFAEPQRLTSPRGDRYPLTGIATCGKCGGRMVGRPQGGVRRYICIAEGPLHMAIKAEPVELFVAQQAARMRPAKFESIQDAQAPLVQEQETIKAQLRELGRKFATGDEFAESAAEELRERLTEIEGNLADPPEASEAEVSSPAAARLLSLTRQGKIKAKPERVQERLSEARPYLESMVEAVTVAPGQGSAADRAGITWRAGVRRATR